MLSLGPPGVFFCRLFFIWLLVRATTRFALIIGLPLRRCPNPTLLSPGNATTRAERDRAHLVGRHHEHGDDVQVRDVVGEEMLV